MFREIDKFLRINLSECAPFGWWVISLFGRISQVISLMYIFPSINPKECLYDERVLFDVNSFNRTKEGKVTLSTNSPVFNQIRRLLINVSRNIWSESSQTADVLAKQNYSVTCQNLHKNLNGWEIDIKKSDPFWLIRQNPSKIEDSALTQVCLLTTAL